MSKDRTTEPRFLPVELPRLSEAEQHRRARDVLREIGQRRSVRQFSGEPVRFELIEAAIRAACSAPSGANQQPWTFVVVSDPAVKREIRIAAEAEEKRNYEQRFPQEWKRVLEPLGTDWHKEFLETAPFLIVVFRHAFGLPPEEPPAGTPPGEPIKHYYVMESVGIASGFLLMTLHHLGLATLTHTPSPMSFLTRILERPRNEKPYLLIPVGYPAPGATVPDLARKPLEEVLIRVEPHDDPKASD